VLAFEVNCVNILLFVVVVVVVVVVVLSVLVITKLEMGLPVSARI